MADCMQFLSKNRLNIYSDGFPTETACKSAIQITPNRPNFWTVRFFENQIRTQFRFSAHPLAKKH